MDDLLYRTAPELAGLVRSGQATPRELMQATLDRIEQLNPVVNAFIDVDAERSLAEADAVTLGNGLPFAGVPIAIKGNIPVHGRPLTHGSAALAGNKVDREAFVVRRLREAGFVIAGMTNIPEFSILPTTEPRHGGPTRNPWDLSRTPGGSSGGSAAAVACGMVPVAHGNDGGGSLRIPAACCGLVGLKPSRGRVSRGPDLGESFLGVDGVLTRTVAGTAAILDVIAGYEPGDATWAPRPSEPYAATVLRDPGKLRIAFTLDNPIGTPISADARAAVEHTAELLSGLGHEVVEAGPALSGEGLLEMFVAVFGPQVALGVEYAQRVRGVDISDDLEPLTRAIRDLATAIPSQHYLGAVAQLQALSRQVIAFFGGHHVLLTPVLAGQPVPIGDLHGCGEQPLDDLRRSAHFAPYTALFNVTGQPAISVPAGLDSDGLPLAVQLVGRPLGEDTLLQVASQLERERPWAVARPDEVQMASL